MTQFHPHVFTPLTVGGGPVRAAAQRNDPSSAVFPVITTSKRHPDSLAEPACLAAHSLVGARSLPSL
jgi:hypothetical protein